MKNKNYQVISRSNLSIIYSKVCDSWKLRIANLMMESKDVNKIEVSNDLIKEAYSKADSGQKTLIEKYFDILDVNLFSKINTYSKVCEHIKEEELTENDFKFLLKERRKKALNQAKIGQLETCFNGDWKADSTDHNQRKYYPVFTTKAGSGGLVFSYSDCHASAFDAEAGLYKDQETSDFIGKNKEFRTIYEGLL